MKKQHSPRALISVTNKDKLESLAKQLINHGYDIFSSGGTHAYLRQCNISVTDISAYIDFPEIMSGRVKTLHPKIHGGILAKRDDQDHMQQAKEHGIHMFDLVVVNLYEFKKHALNTNLQSSEVIEHIDIGGPSMLRSAAKNYQDVCVLSSIEDYADFIVQIQTHDGKTSLDFRQRMAKKTFQKTSAYDKSIFNYFSTQAEEESNSINLNANYALRYGENPHQSAAFYEDEEQASSLLKQTIPGKQLSYNNLLDLHAALKLMSDFKDQTACAILKHNNPCGIGISHSNTMLEAYKKALSGDPMSAFGGIVAFSKTLDEQTAKHMLETFTELVVAPDYTPGALKHLNTKKNLRYLRYTETQLQSVLEKPALRSVLDGFLIQDQDLLTFDKKACEVVTQKQPTPYQWQALELAWNTCKHLKSNAIAICNQDQMLGMGAGQTSRIEACHSAVNRTQKCAADKTHKVAASDAFFPFKDGLEILAHSGVQSIIQPGGSIKDAQIIKQADALGISMVFTGIRHFNH